MLVKSCGGSVTIQDAVVAPGIVGFTNLKIPKGGFSHDTLAKFVNGIAAVCNEREALVHQFIRDDKGIVFIVTFGVKHQIESPEQNALLFGSDAERLAKGIGISICTGLAAGTLYQGPIGSMNTRTNFGIIGLEMNLAARFMSRAMTMQAKERERLATLKEDVSTLTLVMKKVAAYGKKCQVNVVSVGEAKMKGVTLPIEGFLISEHADSEADEQTEEVIRIAGRDEEVQYITKSMHKEALCFVEGQTGVGKTAITTNIARAFNGKSYKMALVRTSDARKNEAWLPMKNFMLQIKEIYPKLNEGPDVLAEIHRMVGENEQNHISLLVLVMPWLHAVLPLEDNATKMSEIEKQSTLVSLIVNITESLASVTPSICLFDDIQWYDDLSWRVVSALVSGQFKKPIDGLIILTTARPNIDVPIYDDFKRKGVPTLKLEPFTKSIKSFALFLGYLNMNPEYTQKIYDENVELVEFIHKSCIGSAAMIKQMALAMQEDHAIEVKDKSVVMLRKLEDMQVGTLSDFIAKRFLKLSSNTQKMLRYAVQMGQLYNNELVTTVLTEEGLTAKEQEDAVAEAVRFQFLTSEQSSQYFFEHDSSVVGIQSMMTRAQTMALSTTLCFIVLKQVGNDISTITMPNWDLLVNLSTRMEDDGQHLQLTIRKEYGYWCMAKMYYPSVDVTLRKIIDALKAKGGSKGYESAMGIDHPEYLNSSPFLQPIVLTKVDIHEILSMIVASQFKHYLGGRETLEAGHMACKIVGFPTSGKKPGLSMVTMGVNFARTLANPLNGVRYSCRGLSKEDRTRLLRNHARMAYMMGQVAGWRFGNGEDLVWWFCECAHLAVLKDAPTDVVIAGSGVLAWIGAGILFGLPVKGYRKLYYKTLDEFNPTGHSDADLARFYSFDHGLRMAIEPKFQFDSQALEASYEKFAVHAVDRLKSNALMFETIPSSQNIFMRAISRIPSRWVSDHLRMAAVAEENNVIQHYLVLTATSSLANVFQCKTEADIAEHRSRYGAFMGKWLTFDENLTDTQTTPPARICSLYYPHSIVCCTDLAGLQLIHWYLRLPNILQTIECKSLHLGLVYSFATAWEMLIYWPESLVGPYRQAIIKVLDKTQRCFLRPLWLAAGELTYMSICSDFFHAGQRVVKKPTKAVKGAANMVKVAKRAYHHKYMSIYCQAMIAAAGMTRNDTLFEEMLAETQNFGIRGYAYARATKLRKHWRDKPLASADA